MSRYLCHLCPSPGSVRSAAIFSSVYSQISVVCESRPPCLLFSTIDAPLRPSSRFQHMAPVTQATASIFKTIDPENYKRYRERSWELDAKPTLRPFPVSQHACFVGNDYLVGLECKLHRDVRDTKDGWVADVAFGDFKEGNLQVLQLGLRSTWNH